MWFTTAGAFSVGEDGIVRGLLLKPRPCPCGRMTYFVINRDGASRCVECDLHYQLERAGCASGLYSVGL